MALSPGTRLGPYEITAQIGVGGMGEVYRATDTNLKRAVAIKVLPDAVADDPERLARFQREAEVLAALNHPNIAAIYGLERTGATTALVMELVEGPTLADRIAQGPISVADSLEIAKQIAGALEAAHDQGIIHRDLKPANVKVTPAGTVKVLDFGLAKAMEPTGAMSASVSISPTITSPAMTQMGVILGTAAYMSPEQAAGKAADKRSDLWAFGVVLMEMLTSRRVFTGETVSHVLASVLTSEPDWTALPASTPPLIRRLLRRCLEKDRRQRLADAADARLDIEEASSTRLYADGTTISAGVAPRSVGARALPWAVAGLLGMALVGVLVWASRGPAPVPGAPELHLDLATPPTNDPLAFALSPDGQHVAFVAAAAPGPPQLWVRSLAADTAQPLSGTSQASSPFWSPDSRSIGFYADGRLKRLDLEGGAAQTLALAPNALGAAWSRTGVIVFAWLPGLGLSRVSASGGEVTPVTSLDPKQHLSHRYPSFLSDGERFLFFAQGTRPDSSGIYLGALDGSAPRRLIATDSAARALGTDRLVFVRQGTLWVQRFDANRGTVVGDPVAVADGVVAGDVARELPGVSVSETGTLAYRRGEATVRSELMWFDRAGKPLATAAARDLVGLFQLRLSKDGRQAVLDRVMNGNSDIWRFSLPAWTPTRFTFDEAPDLYATWSSDETRIFFSSARTGTYHLYVKDASGAGRETLLLESPYPKVPLDVSPTDRVLLYREVTPTTGRDLLAVPLTGDPTPFPVVRTPADEGHGQFSPDGRWLAYQSDGSGGQFEIYVQPFPGPGGTRQVSLAGGTQALWRRDGQELFFIDLDGRLMAVPMRLGRDGQTAEIGAPRALFTTRLAGGPVVSTVGHRYAATPDGQRFLVLSTPEGGGPASHITLLLNWRPKGR